MKAEGTSLKEIVEREPHRLEVPFFQRRYVWSEENWKELLEAVENFKREKVFWGSIIIKLTSEKDPELGYGKGYIIDGQQRLTTIAVLTKAIYDMVGEAARKDWARDIIEDDIFFKPYASAAKDKYQLIIEHSRVDRKDYEYIVRTGVYDIGTMEFEDDEHGQIGRCYRYYRESLKNHSQKQLSSLMNNLYSDEKVFVLIRLDEEDVNEQAIFDAINRAGQKLYTSDIIKNNLYKKIMNKGAKEKDVCRMCELNWDRIFWTDDIWEQKRNFGNVSKTHLDFLLYCVACIRWPQEPVQSINDRGRLEVLFEEKTDQYSLADLQAFIEDIAKYALIYKKYVCNLSNDQEETTYGKEDIFPRLMLIMDKFKIQMFYPYILKRLYENITEFSIDFNQVSCNIDDQGLNQDARILETFIMRRRIYGAGTSGYSKKCMDILQKGAAALYTEEEPDTEAIMSENRQIGEGLKNLNTEVAKMVLFCLELERWDEKDDLGELTYTYQIEHILPRQWKKYWPLLGEDEAIEMREESIQEIGNMILLSQKLNKHIVNREFAVKMEGELSPDGKIKKEGYKTRTQLKITKDIVDNYYDNNDKVWDEAHIKARTEALKTAVLDHWNIHKALKEQKICKERRRR